MSQEYNGWANYETWNVALYMDNDYESYELAKTCKNFHEYRKAKNLRGEPLTGNHISLFDDKLNIKELDEKIEELQEPSDQEMLSSFGTKWHDGL